MSIDYAPLLTPRKQPPFSARTIDALSWVLPAGAAVLGGGAALAALNTYQIWAALLAITSAVASLFSIRFVTWGIAIRDQRLAEAEIVADIASSGVERLERIQPTSY